MVKYLAAEFVCGSERLEDGAGHSNPPTSCHNTGHHRYNSLDNGILASYTEDITTQLDSLKEKAHVIDQNELQMTIRIYHECEGGIEKSVPNITVWHHEACRVMTNGDPAGQIFLSYPHTNNGFFFLLTTVLFIYLL